MELSKAVLIVFEFIFLVLPFRLFLDLYTWMEK